MASYRNLAYGIVTTVNADGEVVDEPYNEDVHSK